MGDRCVVICPECDSQEIGFNPQDWAMNCFECHECNNIFSKEEANFEEQ